MYYKTSLYPVYYNSTLPDYAVLRIVHKTDCDLLLHSYYECPIYSMTINLFIDTKSLGSGYMSIDQLLQ